jgi:hypothetical protein
MKRYAIDARHGETPPVNHPCNIGLECSPQGATLSWLEEVGFLLWIADQCRRFL